MLAEIRKQFYKDTLKELEGINGKLASDNIPPEEQSLIAEKVFSVSHQISGTGPMLGFDSTSLLSKKLESTFYDIRRGEKKITPQLLWQTKRVIDAMIKSFNEENNSQ